MTTRHHPKANQKYIRIFVQKRVRRNTKPTKQWKNEKRRISQMAKSAGVCVVCMRYGALFDSVSVTINFILCRVECVCANEYVCVYTFAIFWNGSNALHAFCFLCSCNIAFLCNLFAMFMLTLMVFISLGAMSFFSFISSAFKWLFVFVSHCTMHLYRRQFHIHVWVCAVIKFT